MTLTRALSTLETAGLIRLVAAHPELAYIFRHTLVREAAYDSLLLRQRRALHHAAGEVLEASAADEAQRAELAPLLAYHFDEAGDAARALRYFRLAGEAAAAQFALHEAIALLSRALALARTQPSEENAGLTALYAARGHALRSADEWDAARQNFVEMEADARARGDETMRLNCLIEQATMTAVLGPFYEPERAHDLSLQALSLADQLHDQPARARILWNLMRSLAPTDPERAIQVGQEALALSRRLGLAEQVAYTLNDLHYAYRGAARPVDALAVLEEARHTWRALGKLDMLADNLTQSVSILITQGRLDEAERITQETEQAAVRSHQFTFAAFSHMTRALIYSDRGRSDLAWQSLDTATRQTTHPFLIDLGNLIRLLVWFRLGAWAQLRPHLDTIGVALRTQPDWPEFGQNVLGLRARALLVLGGVPEAAAALAEAIQLASRTKRFATLSAGTSEHSFLAEIELALARGDLEAALEVSGAYASELRRQTLRGLLPEALDLRAAALEAAGNPEAACAALLEARDIAAEVGQGRTLWAVSARLAAHEARRGRLAAASTLRREAAAAAHFMADHAGTPELRQSFLSLPTVRDVLHSP